MTRENQASIVDWHRATGAVLCASEQAARINERFAILLSEWVGPRRPGFLKVNVADTTIAVYLLAELRRVELVEPTSSNATSSFWLDSGAKHASRIVRAANAAHWSDVDDRLQSLLNCFAAFAGHLGSDLDTAVTERMAVLRRQASEQAA